MASIQGIYIALFGRPADPAGLAFFNEATNNGADLTAIGDLASTAEYQDRFIGMSNEEIINSIYQSLFERDGEAEGVAFWAAALEDGTYNINNIAIAILDGALGSDLDTVNAKIAAANLFTERLDLDEEIEAYAGDFAAQVGRDYIDAVNADDAATEEEADAAILRLLDPGEGQTPGGGGAGDVVAPVFTSGAVADIDENEAAGSVVYTAAATDDRGGVQLSLGGADAGAFTFDATTGKLSINASPDYETKSSYTVDITATDFSGNATVQTVTISINDVNEAPVLTGNQTVFSVAENNAKTTIATFSVVDPDAGDTRTFSVDNANFEISNAGVLSLKAGIDYETDAHTQTVTVTVTDSGGLTDTETLSVNITDVVENQTHTFTTVGNKTITDFVAGDKIDVSAIDAQQTYWQSTGPWPWDGYYAATGDQAFSFGGVGGNAAFGQLVYQHVGGNTIVRGDTTHTGSADDLTITITGIHNLTAGDFIL